MPISVSDHLGIPESSFDATGAFDAILDIDSELYLDPYLLRRMDIPELAGAHRRLCDYFADIQDHLRRSRSYGDGAWTNAVSRLRLGEAGWLCLGVTSGSTAGSGIGPQLADDMAKTIQRLLKGGVDDHDVFEILPFLQDGLGRDRLSDWVANVIRDDLLQYSERVYSDLGGVVGEGEFIRGRRYRLPQNPFTRTPIVLVPRAALRPMPTILDWRDYEGVRSRYELQAALNDAVPHASRRKTGGRSKVGNATWADILRVQSGKKRTLFMEHPELAKALLDAYRLKTPEPYDFERDPVAALRWYRTLAKFLATKAMPSDQLAARADACRFTRAVATEFQTLIQRHSPQSLLYDGSKPKSVLVATRLFQGLWEKRHDALNKPFHSLQSQDAALVARPRQSHQGAPQRVLIGHLRENRLAKAFLALSKTVGAHERLLIIAIDTELGYPSAFRYLQTLIQQGTIRTQQIELVFVDARYSVFQGAEPAKIVTPPPPDPPRPVPREVRAPVIITILDCPLCKQPLTSQTLLLHLRASHKQPARTLIQAVWPTVTEARWEQALEQDGLPCPTCAINSSEQNWYQHLQTHQTCGTLKAWHAYLEHLAATAPRPKPVKRESPTPRSYRPAQRTAHDVADACRRRYQPARLASLSKSLLQDKRPLYRDVRRRLHAQQRPHREIEVALLVVHIQDEEEKRLKRILSYDEERTIARWVENGLRR